MTKDTAKELAHAAKTIELGAATLLRMIESAGCEAHVCPPPCPRRDECAAKFPTYEPEWRCANLCPINPVTYRPARAVVINVSINGKQAAMVDLARELLPEIKAAMEAKP